MANNLDLTSEHLDEYVGLSVDDFCGLGFGDLGDEHNHCAHFVGHALSLNASANVGLTCAAMTRSGRAHQAEGACLRVNEVFNRQTQLAEADEKGCLVYITMQSNLTGKPGAYTMGQAKKKHIGIYLGGQVWHYGNNKDKVRKQSLEEFEEHYSGDTIVLFTRFPQRAVFARAAD